MDSDDSGVTLEFLDELVDLGLKTFFQGVNSWLEAANCAIRRVPLDDEIVDGLHALDKMFSHSLSSVLESLLERRGAPNVNKENTVKLDCNK